MVDSENTPVLFLHFYYFKYVFIFYLLMLFYQRPHKIKNLEFVALKPDFKDLVLLWGVIAY